MRLRMLKLCVGKGRQVMKQLCLRYYATVATERAGYMLSRALVLIVIILFNFVSLCGDVAYCPVLILHVYMKGVCIPHM